MLSRKYTDYERYNIGLFLYFQHLIKQEITSFNLVITVRSGFKFYDKL